MNLEWCDGCHQMRQQTFKDAHENPGRRWLCRDCRLAETKGDTRD